MKFKRIELYGFKSFADKHEIPFGSGITGIVGPNGCGKSNVADSIRWVLGEQSAKLLRGSSMQDVIFNGTEKRKSMSYCEVALVFDNREKLFPSLDYEEVVISHKLYRSGESEYAINRTPCRRKDIIDLLHDGGMGREGYSIIGQGRIDELLSAKPEDRRAIFEEAAGISKFKERKVDAERKLTRTRENLVRIIDILDEKAKQLEPLNRQAENARKWLDMRDSLRRHEINIYIHQFETASQAKEVINTRLAGLAENIDLKQKSYDAAVSSYNEAMYDIGSIDKNINELHKELLALTVDLEKQAGDMKVLRERMGALVDRNRRIAEETAALKEEYKAGTAKTEEATARRDDAAAKLIEAQKEVEAQRESYMRAVEKLTEGESSAEENRKALIEAMDRLAEIKANMSRLLAERDSLSSSVAVTEGKIAENNDALAENRRQLETLTEELAALAAKKDALAAGLKESYAKNNALLSEATAVTDELDKLNEKFIVAQSRRKILKEMQEAYEGFAFSVRNIMNDAKKNADLARKIEGVVAQLITMDAKFETAIETALGQAMQNIVTRDEQDAQYIIEYLKKMKYGRITFLPMTSIKPRDIDPRYDRAIKANGCYGAAADLVRYDRKYDNIVRGLLGNTVIVNDLTTAISLAKTTGYAFKIVTLEGEVINPSGAITGGGKRGDIANIFSHERELKELDGLVAKLGEKTADLALKRDRLAEEIDEVQSAIKTAQSEMHGAELEIAGKTEAKNTLSADIDALVRVTAETEKDLAGSRKRIEEINSDLGSVSKLEELISRKRQSATRDEESRRSEQDALKAERDAVQEKLTSARLAVTELESEIKGYDSDIARMKEEGNAILLRIEAADEEKQSNAEQISVIEKSLRSTEKRDGAADEKRVAEIRAKLDGLDEYKANLQEKVADFDKRRIDLMNELQSLRDGKNREEMLLLKVDTDIEQMEERVRDEYNLEYADCLQFREEGYNVSAGTAEAARLKRAMNALGSVNVEAIEMSQTVSAEYNALNTQKEDLEKAEADLMKIIKELSDEMLERFTGQFEQIRTNFIKIFKELFDGGNADLELLDSENPLEAGIEIKAQPPEKKLQSISLLSGGERALTAIAILFAILKLKPMPFCLLDEIEAALDDANANRFAKYLRRFSEDTQFIVITHRKPTMELADRLYGVTMEEKGVSKIVSVKLEDAIKVDKQ